MKSSPSHQEYPTPRTTPKEFTEFVQEPKIARMSLHGQRVEYRRYLNSNGPKAR